MFLQRSAATIARRGAVAAAAPIVRRSFATSVARRFPESGTNEKNFKPLSAIKAEEDLVGPGAEPGTIPTDLEQATGMERLEILGKIEGIDVFDMKPLDASRKGTLENPILVRSAGDEQYAGCTGCPADSHNVIWLTLTRDRPVNRCIECGSVYKMDYIGPPEDPHHDHHHHGYEEPKTFADYVKPEYY